MILTMMKHDLTRSDVMWSGGNSKLGVRWKIILSYEESFS